MKLKSPLRVNLFPTQDVALEYHLTQNLVPAVDMRFFRTIREAISLAQGGQMEQTVDFGPMNDVPVKYVVELYHLGPFIELCERKEGQQSSAA